MHPRKRRPHPRPPQENADGCLLRARPSASYPARPSASYPQRVGAKRTSPPHTSIGVLACESAPTDASQTRGCWGLPRNFSDGGLPRAAPLVSSLRALETDVVPAHEHRRPTRERAPADASAGAPTSPRLPQENVDGRPHVRGHRRCILSGRAPNGHPPPRTSIGVLPRESAPTDASQARGRRGLPREYVNGSLPRAAPSVSSLRAPETDVVPAHEHRHPTRESAPADASAGAPTYPRLPQENADGCPPCARPSTLYPQRVGAKRTSPPRTSIGVLPRESAPTDASKARGRQGLPREVISRTDAFAGASTSPKTPPRER